MKRIPSLFFVVALTGALCAQPGQGQRPGGDRGQGQRPGGDRGQVFHTHAAPGWLAPRPGFGPVRSYTSEHGQANGFGLRKLNLSPSCGPRLF